MTVDLAAQCLGEGPPLVVLHGLFGSARNWAGIARRLGDRYRVHALDLRNHGESPWTEALDYPLMAGDVAAYIEREIGDGPAPVVVGHSMGGKVAMTLALLHPGRVGALVVADIAPVAYRPGLDAFAEAMLAVPLAGLARRSQVEALLADSIPSPGIRRFLAQNIVEDPAGGLRWRLNLEGLRREMATLAGFPAFPADRTFSGRTLVVRGALSDYVGEAERPAFERLFPGYRLATLKGAGHWLHSEKPEAFVDILRGFLGAPAAP
ncbi:alpha/beta fold hydrolase [Rhodospirillum rubrum]|uniref:Alpha/beta hydrolase fold n=1 Tax=Rhodospirillum rubrum (strain ATCC 11170 / ATH 1.1.1 / DSM 467 / LMG 4362 / NCIMB 8255 / S1) TaxID=269796 RepID=Q2RQU1_RHORT|nr:alpha/beta fold hydrolase [Rhodospirillum rubrum]ABC23504.1 Alpha/beta hydrolase fold [Rhodospirillum rubrum ATCC 11170]AEO49243.1 alpha/beta hydrolase fold protein [Rhodospirillum rubrum F11]MBK5955176.1 alpha/beta hydrolase [Rhodospirillum rubrum]QXG79472.1 alpha/beta fold hydrolase [Rhodospirillum rubrum]HCF19239.1 alpha/beta hydrolase [Rhodospirillum rubrum]